MSAKGVETMLKTSEMTLKTPEINLSFGLNGSHKARKFFSAKGPGFCPPPDTSKTNSHKELQPIMTAHDRKNGRNCFPISDLWNRPFSKKIMSGHYAIIHFPHHRHSMPNWIPVTHRSVWRNKGWG